MRVKTYVNGMDAEANAFAMELLMPAEWLWRDAAEVDICEERGIEKLARKYRVPMTVMAARLGQLFALRDFTPTPGEEGT